MTGYWHTDRRVGEIAVLPNGTRVRIVSVRGKRVRLEYLDPARANPAPDSASADDDITPSGTARRPR